MGWGFAVSEGGGGDADDEGCSLRQDVLVVLRCMLWRRRLSGCTQHMVRTTSLVEMRLTGGLVVIPRPDIIGRRNTNHAASRQACRSGFLHRAAGR